MTKVFTPNGISYTKVGLGPHLCFLHGFCESNVVWETLITELKQDYTCIAIDLPGFGNSKKLAFTSMEHVAQQIIDLWDAEGITQVTVFGHSMGGYVMSAIAKLAPTRLKAVGYIHSTSQSDSEEKRLNRQKTIDFIEKNGTAEFFKLFTEALVSPNHLERLLPQLRTLVNDTEPQAILSASKAMMVRQDHLATLTALDLPTLFVHGQHDAHLQAHDIYAQAAQCKKTQVSLIKDCGHLSMLEAPKQCAEVIQEFLRFTAALTAK